MVQNATEDEEDVRSINAEKGCSHAELMIVGDSNKLVYITSRTEALSSNKLHNYIFHCSFTDKTLSIILRTIKQYDLRKARRKVMVS